MKVVVYVSGGIVQSVKTDEDIDVLVVDFDTDNDDIDEEVVLIDNKLTRTSLYSSMENTIDPNEVKKVFELYENSFLQ